MWIEKGVGWRHSLKHFRQELTLAHLAVGLTTFILAASAPLVVLLAAANQAHLPLELTISWICINYLKVRHNCC
jgi:predicted benzoate:H+ symporter BenE